MCVTFCCINFWFSLRFVFSSVWLNNMLFQITNIAICSMAWVWVAAFFISLHYILYIFFCHYVYFFTTFRHSFFLIHSYIYAQLFSLNVRTFTRCNFRIGQLPMKHKLTMPHANSCGILFMHIFCSLSLSIMHC